MDRYWTEEEQARLLAALRNAPAHHMLARRDDAAIRALLRSGCRVGEFLKVTVGDAMAALRDGYLFIPREARKGGKRDHHVFVTAELGRDLRDLLAIRAELVPGDCRIEDRLVVGRHGRGITVRNFELRVKHWARVAGLPPGSSPHWARHTRGQNIMRRSSARDPRGVVQKALGHADIRSSGVYTVTPREEVEAALQEVDAAGGRRRVTKQQLRRAYEQRTVL